MSKWSCKNGEEEINLRYLMDKAAEAGELNLLNREGNHEYHFKFTL